MNIFCQNCEHSCSELAPFCPQCGHPLRETLLNKWKGKARLSPLFLKHFYLGLTLFLALIANELVILGYCKYQVYKVREQIEENFTQGLEKARGLNNP